LKFIYPLFSTTQNSFIVKTNKVKAKYKRRFINQAHFAPPYSKLKFAIFFMSDIISQTNLIVKG